MPSLEPTANTWAVVDLVPVEWYFGHKGDKGVSWNQPKSNS